MSDTSDICEPLYRLKTILLKDNQPMEVIIAEMNYELLVDMIADTIHEYSETSCFSFIVTKLPT